MCILYALLQTRRNGEGEIDAIKPSTTLMIETTGLIGTTSRIGRRNSSGLFAITEKKRIRGRKIDLITKRLLFRQTTERGR